MVDFASRQGRTRVSAGGVAALRRGWPFHKPQAQTRGERRLGVKDAIYGWTLTIHQDPLYDSRNIGHTKILWDLHIPGLLPADQEGGLVLF
jgi:hypothetical protein